MPDWSLPTILESLHDNVGNKLALARKSFSHPGTKGDATEKVWLELFRTYLPERYSVNNAHIVDSEGNFSDQIDVVIYDRQYSPFVFSHGGQVIIPAESVYAVFEAKQTMNAGMIKYAQKKLESVRKLHRTSLPIPHAGGVYPPKELIQIIGGILTLESEWSSPVGDNLEKNLNANLSSGKLNMGCSASHGYFYFDSEKKKYIRSEHSKSGTLFLFKLIEMLQFSGTVPMIDVQAYAKWMSTK